MKRFLTQRGAGHCWAEQAPQWGCHSPKPQRVQGDTWWDPLGFSVQDQESDSMILGLPLQLRVFYDSILLWSTKFLPSEESGLRLWDTIQTVQGQLGLKQIQHSVGNSSMGVACCHPISTAVAQQTWKFIFSIRWKRCRNTKLTMVVCYYNFWVWHLKDTKNDVNW